MDDQNNEAPDLLIAHGQAQAGLMPIVFMSTRFLFALLLLLPTWVSALELNDASRAQIEQLNGVGVNIAEVILKERAKAPFRDWADFQQRVKGMKRKRVEQLQAQGVTVNGVPSTFSERQSDADNSRHRHGASRLPKESMQGLPNK